MPHWVECTAGNGQSVFVNLNLIVAISRIGEHTQLTYAGEDGGAMVVSDTPQEILSMPRLGVTS